MDPTFPLQDDEPVMDLVTGLQTHRNCKKQSKGKVHREIL